MKGSGGIRAALVTGLMIVVPALAIAGCGASDAPKSENASEGERAPAADSAVAVKATGKPIVLGNVGTYSGTASPGTEYNEPILEYWVRTVNARGGINGHPIKLIVQDDGSEAAKSVTEVKDLVENKKVIGFVGNFWSRTSPASAPYLLRKGVPVVGGDSAVTNPWFTNPMFFPVLPSLDKHVGVAQMAVTKQQGITKIALIRNDNGAATNGSADAIERDAPKHGVDIVLEQTVSLAAPNYQSNCLAARDAGAKGVAFVADTATIARLQVSCARIGYQPTFLPYGIQLSTQQLTVPNSVAAGMQGLFPFFMTTGSPALEEWGKATAGAPDGQIGNKTASVWASAKLIEKALTIGVPEGATPTTAGLLKGLYSLEEETLGGLTIPLTYHKDKPADLPNCWFTYAMRDQKFTAPSLEATCA